MPQAVDFVNAPESFKAVEVDTSQMLSEANQYSVDLRDVRGPMSAKRALEVDTRNCVRHRSGKLSASV